MSETLSAKLRQAEERLKRIRKAIFPEDDQGSSSEGALGTRGKWISDDDSKIKDTSLQQKFERFWD